MTAMTHNLSFEDYDIQAENTMPWTDRSEAMLARQTVVQNLLRQRAGAEFSENCFVAEDAKVFTWRLIMKSNSWIASGAIVRGHLEIGSDSSINSYAHVAGHVTVGDGCMIASLASIYGFNHGHSRTDVPMRSQSQTSIGVEIGDDVWIGAGAVILDGVRIGSHSIVAAGAIVTKSFDTYSIIGGNPARVIGSRR